MSKHNPGFIEKVTGMFKVNLINFYLNKVSPLKFSEYINFWNDCLSKPQSLPLFLHEVMVQIANLEQKRECGIQNSTTFSLQGFLCTFLVTTLYGNTEKCFENDQHKIMSHWDTHIAKQSENKKQKFNPNSDAIMKCIHLYGLEQDIPAFISNLIGQICFMPDISEFQVDSHNNDLKLNQEIQNFYLTLSGFLKAVDKQKQYFSVLVNDECVVRSTGELSYAYDYLVYKVLFDNKKSTIPPVYSSIIKYFKLIPHISKEFPEEGEKCALALLHFTQQVITYTSYNNIEKEKENIKEILKQVFLFRRWPHPVGTLSQELAQLLISECISMGSSFRNQLREEIPFIDVLFGEPMSIQEEQQKEGKLFLNLNQNVNEKSMQDSDLLEKVIQAYLVSDDQSYEAFVIFNFLDSNYNQSIRIHSLNNYRISMILNLLHGNLQKEVLEDIQKKINFLNTEEVFQIYTQLIQIIEIANDIQSQVQMGKIMEFMFDDLVKDIYQLRSKSELDHFDSDEFYRELKATQLPDFPTCKIQNLTNFKSNHLLSQLNLNPTQVLKQSGFKHFLLGEQIKIIFSKLTVHPLKQYVPPLRFLVLGGDIQLHNLVQELAQWFAKDPKIFSEIIMKIYIVPIQRNTLAQFIAAKDHWYSRYLYKPFVQELIYPKFEGVSLGDLEKEKELGDAQEYNILPFYLNSNLIQTYLREAQRILHVRVYECQIKQYEYNIKGPVPPNFQFTPQNLNERQDIIYFCQYIEIGAPVVAEINRYSEQSTDKKGHQDLSYYHYIDQNNVQFTYHELNINITGIDFEGNLINKSQDFTQKDIQIHSLQINNGNMPFPNSQWLEMTYITHENSHIFDQNLKQQNNFQSYPQQQIQSAFQALHTSLPINDTIISCQLGQYFDVNIDGKIIPYVQSMHVRPFKTNKVYKSVQKYFDSEPQQPAFRLPIMTFLPLQI